MDTVAGTLRRKTEGDLLTVIGRNKGAFGFDPIKHPS